MEPPFIIKLTKKMKGNLSGQASHQKMMVQPRYISPDNKTPIPAAVLILLYPDKKQWHFFLTKRTKTVEHHKGQISLPGGMLEEGESNKEAAIRETYEEMGIESKRIDIIGSLTPLHIPVSGFKIFPFVGWIKEKPKLKIQTNEVSRVLSPTIENLLDKRTQKEKYSRILGKKVKIPFFDLDNETVWGATSMILSEFRSVLKGAS